MPTDHGCRDARGSAFMDWLPRVLLALAVLACIAVARGADLAESQRPADRPNTTAPATP